MRQLSPSLQDHLNTGATTLCTCWRIVRRDGVALGFTDHDRPLTFDDLSFRPESGADGSRLEATADLAVDNAEIEGALTDDALSTDDLAAGRYDGAQIEIWRVNWAAPSERVLLKTGVLGEVVREGERFRVEIRGLTHALSRTVGRVYQRQCDAVVGDGRCGVDLQQSTYRADGAVVALLGEQRFSVLGLGAFDADWFADGVLRWIDGANTGLSAPVKTHQSGGGAGADGIIELWLPTGAPIAAGDRFVVTAGCDRRAETCRGKFNNIINFRGFHLMPGNDFAVSYPTRTDQNDGGRR